MYLYTVSIRITLYNSFSTTNAASLTCRMVKQSLGIPVLSVHLSPAHTLHVLVSIGEGINSACFWESNR